MHHHSRVHVFVDEETLCKPLSEIVARDVAKVVIASLFGSCYSSSFDSRPDATLFEFDERLARGDIFDILELLKGSLHIGGEIRVSWLATVPGRILLGGNVKPVLTAVGGLDVSWLDLWDLEGTKADIGAELDDDVVTVACSGASKVFDLVVSQPDFVSVIAVRPF